MKDRAKEERLNRYLEDRMEEEEKKNLEADLAADPSLARDMEESRLAHQVTRAAGRKEILEKLDAFEEEWQNSDDRVSPQKRPMAVVRWLMAAAAAAVLLFGVWWVVQSPNESPDELYAAHFSTFRAPPVLRGENDQVNFPDAVDAYSQGDFARSAQLFTALKADSIVGDVAVFYQGVSLLAMNPPDPNAALTSFEITLLADTDFTEAASWYKALALLKLNRIAEAREVLEKIVSEKTYQQEAAAELLGRLE